MRSLRCHCQTRHAITALLLPNEASTHCAAAAKRGMRSLRCHCQKRHAVIALPLPKEASAHLPLPKEAYDHCAATAKRGIHSLHCHCQKRHTIMRCHCQKRHLLIVLPLPKEACDHCAAAKRGICSLCCGCQKRHPLNALPLPKEACDHCAATAKRGVICRNLGNRRSESVLPRLIIFRWHFAQAQQTPRLLSMKTTSTGSSRRPGLISHHQSAPRASARGRGAESYDL
jgi:hypothetical protein